MADALGVADPRCDAWHPPAIGQGQRERREARRGQPRLHDFDDEEHQAEGLRRGHAGGADGVGSCDGDAMCPSPRQCRGPRPARQRRARLGPARPHVSGPDRGAEPLPEPGEPAITVQNVSVGDGGNAIVGNVTQHASVIVSDKVPAPRRGRRRRSRAPGEGAIPPMPGGKHRHERSHPKYRPDAGEPALRRQNPFRRRMPLAGGARQKALPHARRCTGIGRAEGKPERAQARAVHEGCDRGAKAGFRRCWGRRGSCWKR